MAQRPVFCWQRDVTNLVVERNVEFSWAPGLSRAQKRKRIAALHQGAREQHGVNSCLEISSASPTKIGQELSAFSLMLRAPNGLLVTVEEAYQASKVFEYGGPYDDLLGVGPLMAKRDDRLRTNGALKKFYWFGQEVPLESGTLFYDWLYLNGLNSLMGIYQTLVRYEAFSDIEYNPKKSWACQARSAAVCTGLFVLGKNINCAMDIDCLAKYTEGGSERGQAELDF